MALINCPECNHEVSDKAQACPNCGYKLTENNQIKICARIPLAVAILYCICVCIYACDYLWDVISIVMLIVGLAMTGILLVGQKSVNKIYKYLFAIVYIVGINVVTFRYNISRLDVADGDFFSPYIYNDSLGGFLAVFQIISVVSVVLFCMAIFVPQFFTKCASITLFISGFAGMIFNIYDKVYLQNYWGTTLHSTF